jgi:hypothetical protein
MEQILNGTDFEFEQFRKWTVSNLNNFKSEQFEFEQFWIGTFLNWNSFEFETDTAKERENSIGTNSSKKNHTGKLGRPTRIPRQRPRRNGR